MSTETPKNEPNPAIKSTTPTVKTEEAPQQLEALSKADPNGHPRDASQSPTSSKTIKSENNGSSDALAPAQEAAPVIPTAAADSSTSSTIPAVAPPPGPAPAAAPPASLTAPAAVPPAESVTPAKRSRTPEPDQESSADKKQKTEHAPEHDVKAADNLKTEADASAEASAETSAEANANGDGVSSWDLESMLANALGAVNDAKGAAGADDAMDIDNLTSSPPLPPPRRRLEKMKFIETPTYFSRSMGLPILGSLVSAHSYNRAVSDANALARPSRYCWRSFSSHLKSRTRSFEMPGRRAARSTLP